MEYKAEDVEIEKDLQEENAYKSYKNDLVQLATVFELSTSYLIDLQGYAMMFVDWKH